MRLHPHQQSETMCVTPGIKGSQEKIDTTSVQVSDAVKRMESGVTDLKDARNSAEALRAKKRCCYCLMALVRSKAVTATNLMHVCGRRWSLA